MRIAIVSDIHGNRTALEAVLVEYDVDREIKALADCGLPHADWIAKTLAGCRKHAL